VKDLWREKIDPERENAADSLKEQAFLRNTDKTDAKNTESLS